MNIFPAIDLKDGQVVRLNKGIMNSAKIYSNEPWKVAKNFQDLGLKYIHIVDLNGAFSGYPKNLEEIKKIRKETNLKIQLGGGIRDEDTIKMYLDLGIDRLILGSIAIKNPSFVKKMASKYPIILGIDIIKDMIAIEGWAKVSKIKAIDLAKDFKDNGIQAIICTDISKDGMLSGVNIKLTENISISSSIPTIASGGVKNIEDIKKCKESKNISGVIIGKAFYENNLNIKEAYQIASKINL